MMLAIVLGENVDALRALVVGVEDSVGFALSLDGANNDPTPDLLLLAVVEDEPTRLLSALSPPIAAMAPN
jgi:hypothetical protein